MDGAAGEGERAADFAMTSDSSSGKARISSNDSVTSSLIRMRIDLVDLLADVLEGEDRRPGGYLLGNPPKAYSDAATPTRRTRSWRGRSRSAPNRPRRTLGRPAASSVGDHGLDAGGDVFWSAGGERLDRRPDRAGSSDIERRSERRPRRAQNLAVTICPMPGGAEPVSGGQHVRQVARSSPTRQPRRRSPASPKRRRQGEVWEVVDVAARAHGRIMMPEIDPDRQAEFLGMVAARRRRPSRRCRNGLRESDVRD